ncbi:MAG: hypothetical protein HKN87_08970 [Saprospiraceae bacterium]|nr:hypothetical protein [Saprospiraceae bacterium]
MSKEVEKNQASLEDLGWERMEALLDKEMPTRRGGIWWWAFSGAALVALVTSIWVVQYDNSSMDSGTDTSTHQQGISSAGGVITDIEASDVDATIAQDDLVASPKVDGDVTDENVRGKILPSQDQVEGTATAKRKSVISNQPVISRQTKQRRKSGNLSPDKINKVAAEAEESNSNKARVDKEMTFSTSSSSSLPGTDVSTSEGKTQQNERIKSDGDVPFAAEKALLENFAVLPTVFKFLDNAISIEVPLTNIEASEPILVKSSKKWTASLEIGGLMDASAQKFSWDVGANLGVQVTKNIAVSSGIYLWSIADNEDFSFVEDATFSDLQSANDVLAPEMPRTMDTVTFVSNSHSRWGQTRRITYLRVPLHVRLMPQGRWSPYAGISYIGLLSNRTPTRADTDFVRLDQGSEIIDLLRTSNVSLDLGIAYRPLKHLRIDISYLHGTKSYLNYTIGGNGVPAIHRTLRLSLGYQF